MLNTEEIHDGEQKGRAARESAPAVNLRGCHGAVACVLVFAEGCLEEAPVSQDLLAVAFRKAVPFFLRTELSGPGTSLS